MSPKKRAEVSHATFLNWEAHSAGKLHEQQLTSRLSEDDLVALCRRYVENARRCKRLKPWPDLDNEILHLRRVVTIHANVPTLASISGMDMGNLCTRIAQLFYKHKNDFPQSIAFYELSIVNRMRTHGKDSLEVAASRYNVAMVLSASAKKEKSFNEHNTTLWESKAKDALNHFHAALAIRVQVLGATDPQVANVLQGMGNVWVMIGGLPKAIWCFDRCVKARLIAQGVTHPATKQAHRLLADTLMARGTAIYQVMCYSLPEEVGTKSKTKTPIRCGLSPLTTPLLAVRRAHYPQANTTRYKKAAAVEALSHPSDPKPVDLAPAPEFSASITPATLPLKYQTTLEGTLIDVCMHVYMHMQLLLFLPYPNTGSNPSQNTTPILLAPFLPRFILLGALDHFHRVFFIRSECLGENDMGTVRNRSSSSHRCKRLYPENDTLLLTAL
jgi:hypothetical protein